MYRISKCEREIFGKGENLLLNGSVMDPPADLLSLAGRVQCVYVDPPFMTGNVFTRKRYYGEKGWKKGTPALTLPGYNDSITDEGAYLEFLQKIILLARDLLSDTGVFYLHLDWRMTAHARILCDKIFGKDRFLNEIIWSYESGGRSKKFFPRKHDNILMFSKTKLYRFDLTRVPLSREGLRKNHMARGVDEEGRSYSSIRVGGKEYRYYDDEPVYPGDVWNDIGFLQQRDPERTGYATQKPLKLLDRLLRPVTLPGDWVVDFCCGSGTTLAAASNLGCLTAGMDTSPEALSVTLSRLPLDNISLVSPTVLDDARLFVSHDSSARQLTVEGILTEGGLLPADDPMSNLESWGTGEIRDGVFYANPHRYFRRSFGSPSLNRVLRFASDSLPPAIMTTDAAGTRRVFELS